MCTISQVQATVQRKLKTLQAVGAPPRTPLGWESFSLSAFGIDFRRFWPQAVVIRAFRLSRPVFIPEYLA